MAGALNQTLTCEGNTHVTTPGDIVKCIVIIVIMLLIISGNVCCLVVFNNKRSRRHFMKRVRYIMNSLCCTDLSIGLLMCPSTIYPAIKHCWPFGEGFCKFEALLISALFHESTLNMVLIAIDRYFIVHFPSYHTKMTSKRLMFVILTTWVVVFTTYAIVIFAGEQFYFDEIGVNCEPFYKNPDVTLSVLSIFYFLPALIFIFCYGSIYRTATRHKLLEPTNAEEKHSHAQKRLHANIRTSKYLAAITLAFFVAVSPWTLSTLIIVAANVTLDHTLDFSITWLALSNSFMNCLIYGVMNRKFRRAAMRFTCGRWVKSIRDTISSREEDSKDFSDDTLSRSFSKAKSRASEKKKRLLSANSAITGSPPPSPRPSPKPSPKPSPNASPMAGRSNNIAMNHLSPNDYHD